MAIPASVSTLSIGPCIPYQILAPFAAVRSTDNKNFYQKRTGNLTEYNGPFIQIAPLFPVPRAYSKAQKLQLDLFTYCRNLLKFKSKLKDPKTLKEKSIKLVASLMSYRLIHYFIRKITNMFEGKKCDYWVNLSDDAPLDKITYPKKYFRDPKYIKFEGKKMPVPTRSKALLTQRYGYNYQLLKWDKRKIRQGVSYRKTKTPPTEQ